MKKGFKGFTLVEIMIVVAIIGIIIAIAVPAFLRARETSRARACQENLSKLDGAKEQYALEYKLGDNSAVDLANLVGNTSYLKKTPTCPADDSAYTLGNIGVDPLCTYVEPTWLPAELEHSLTAASTAAP